MQETSPQALKSNPVSHCELRCWILDTGVPQEDADGTFLGYVGSCVDITDRRQATVYGDKVQLQQVMFNLLLNAFDAMDGRPAKDRRVTVFITLESPLVVRVAVRDRGAGLPNDRLATIFNPFVTSKPEGLGLGLSISRTIVEMHRGRLWAENNADQGATFYFTLPVGVPCS